MGALIPLLLPLIPSLISGVESIFKGKPKSGSDKMGAVTDALRMIVEKMMAAGIPVAGAPIPPKSVSDDLLRGMIEAELTRLKAGGKLDGAPVGVDLYLVRGTVVPIPVA